jgi:hypothetical protein
VPLVLQLHRIDGQGEYVEFIHLENKKITCFGNSSTPIHLLLWYVQSSELNDQF